MSIWGLGKVLNCVLMKLFSCKYYKRFFVFCVKKNTNKRRMEETKCCCIIIVDSGTKKQMLKLWLLSIITLYTQSPHYRIR